MAKIFPDGIYYNKPREGAPEFVRGSLSIQVDKLIPFLQQHKNAQGYVNIDMLLSKEKALYLALNEWKKPDSLGYTKEKKTSPQPVSKPTGTNSDGSPVPNFDIEAEEVFNSWNEPTQR